MKKEKKDFEVYTYATISDDYVHWSDGLKMMIIKDGVKIKLNEEEIELIVKSLPRTIGGVY